VRGRWLGLAAPAFGWRTGVDSFAQVGRMVGMSDEITWPFVALMAVLVAGQAVFVWLASR
jgi:hypothetical protein